MIQHDRQLYKKHPRLFGFPLLTQVPSQHSPLASQMLQSGVGAGGGGLLVGEGGEGGGGGGLLELKLQEPLLGFPSHVQFEMLLHVLFTLMSPQFKVGAAVGGFVGLVG